MDKIRLTQYSRYSGCGAKLGVVRLKQSTGWLETTRISEPDCRL